VATKIFISRTLPFAAFIKQVLRGVFRGVLAPDPFEGEKIVLIFNVKKI